MTSGRGAPALAAGDLLVDTTTANSDHLAVGQSVPVKFALDRADQTMRIGGDLPAQRARRAATWSARPSSCATSRTRCPAPSCLKTDGSPGVQQAVTRALAPYPNVKVQSRAQFEATQTAQVNQLLGLVYALLALAVVIALIGIVNTLMLSVFERTHEIGLLRAVGMKRRQIRAMIRSESVILAVFGAIIGIIIGTGLGIALVSVAALAGHHRHRGAGAEPGRLPGPGGPARPARRQLAGAPRRPARRAGRHRGRVRPLLSC